MLLLDNDGCLVTNDLDEEFKSFSAFMGGLRCAALAARPFWQEAALGMDLELLELAALTGSFPLGGLQAAVLSLSLLLVGATGAAGADSGGNLPSFRN